MKKIILLLLLIVDINFVVDVCGIGERADDNVGVCPFCRASISIE